MTFALKSHGMAVGAVGFTFFVFGCAEGVAGKEPFDGVDNDAIEERDASLGGADSGQGNRGASNGGASGANGASNGGATASTGDVGGAVDAGTVVMPPDAGLPPDAGTATCQPGTTACGTLCVDLKSSASNCGRCGHICPGGQACNGAGACLAPAGCTAATYETHDYFHCTGPKNWLDARAACLAWGMDLATIESAPEGAIVNARPGWVGFNDRTTEGAWLWVKVGGDINGPTATWTNWDLPNEPNNDRHCDFLGISCDSPSGEDCAEVLNDGTWNDAICDNTRAFWCESK